MHDEGEIEGVEKVIDREVKHKEVVEKVRVFLLKNFIFSIKKLCEELVEERWKIMEVLHYMKGRDLVAFYEPYDLVWWTPLRVVPQMTERR